MMATARQGQQERPAKWTAPKASGTTATYVVIVGRFSTNVGFFMVIPFLTVYVTQDAGMTGLQAGLLFAMLNVTRRILGIPAGWASDRFGAHRILVVGLVVEVVSYTGFVAAGRSFALWLAAVALLGMGGSLNNNGARSLLAATSTSARVLNLSRYYVSINGAALIGPLIGTALLASGAIRNGFLITAGLHLVFALASAVLLRGLPSPDTSSVHVRDIAVPLRDRHLMLYCGLAVAGWFLITQYNVALPLTVVHQRLSTDLVGPLTSLNAITVMVTVSIIGKRLANRGTLGRLDVLALGTVVLGGGWLMCAITGIAPIVAAVITTSVGESLFCGVVDAMAAELAPRGRTGLYLGYSTMAWGLGAVLAGLSGGGLDLAARNGMPFVFWAGLAAAGCLGAVGIRLARRNLTDAVDVRRSVPESTTTTTTSAE